MLDSGARQNVIMSIFRMTEALVEVATESAVVLAAGVAALQTGLGSDVAWQELRQKHIRNRVSDRLDERAFDDAWNRGLVMTVDALVVLARETVDAAWPLLVT
jgi:hypothetical protein